MVQTDSISSGEPIKERAEHKLEQKKEKELELVDILKIFAPGTSIRTAIDDIVKAGLGALIVFEKEELYGILEGGFRVNCRFTPQRLIELAKMDGAIVISKDMKKILYANTLLVPSIEIPTKETGTRHKASERAAKQIKTIVVAVSERKNKITIYYGNLKYALRDSSEILRRTAETLQILEKQKEIFNELLSNLNVLEITNLIMASDICSILRRIEIISKIAETIRRDIIELGKEGMIVSMRLRELTKNMGKEKEMILRDYFSNRFSRTKLMLENMNFDFLLDNQNVARMLFEITSDEQVFPKGFRILSKTSFSEKDIKSLIRNFQNLEEIMNANRENLFKIFKKEPKTESVQLELKNLKEKIMIGKNI